MEETETSTTSRSPGGDPEVGRGAIKAKAGVQVGRLDPRVWRAGRAGQGVVTSPVKELPTESQENPLPRVACVGGDAMCESTELGTKVSKAHQRLTFGRNAHGSGCPSPGTKTRPALQASELIVDGAAGGELRREGVLIGSTTASPHPGQTEREITLKLSGQLGVTVRAHGIEGPPPVAWQLCDERLLRESGCVRCGQQEKQPSADESASESECDAGETGAPRCKGNVGGGTTQQAATT